MHGHQLTMQVSDMQEREVAERFEYEQLGFGQALLRSDAPERTRGTADRACGGKGGEQQVTATDERHSGSFSARQSNARSSMADSGHAELQPGILCCQVELEVAVFLRVRRQLIGADRHRAPLEALADVPERLPAGPPGREMIELPAQFPEPLAANPFGGALLRRVTVGAGEVELPNLALGQGLAALVGGFCRWARDIGVDWRIIR